MIPAFIEVKISPKQNSVTRYHWCQPRDKHDLDLCWPLGSQGRTKVGRSFCLCHNKCSNSQVELTTTSKDQAWFQIIPIFNKYNLNLHTLNKSFIQINSPWLISWHGFQWGLGIFDNSPCVPAYSNHYKVWWCSSSQQCNNSDSSTVSALSCTIGGRQTSTTDMLQALF